MLIKHRKLCMLAVAASMAEIRPYILGMKTRKRRAVVKRDRTFVTEVDHLSRKAARAILLPLKDQSYSMEAEDGQGFLNPGATYEILFDGLDGTYGFMIFLPTCTVILAIYDKATGEITACFIGEPSTGQIWWSADGSGCFRERYDFQRKRFVEKTDVHVWEKGMGEGSTIFLDVSHGFPREKGKPQVLSDTNLYRLFANLSGKTKVLIPGSNGLIHALTANGGEGVVGGITTAMGGPWDAAGVYLVIQAGGFARASRVKISDGSLPRRTLVEANPLDPHNYDIVVFGNSKATVDKLVQEVNTSII